MADIELDIVEPQLRSNVQPVLKKNTPVAYVYIAPALIMYGLFFLWPVFRLIQLSLQRWDGLSDPKYVGLGNYRTLLFDDPLFWTTFWNNASWMLAAIIVPVVAGLLLAILLERTAIKGRVIFRTIYFLPQVISSVVVAIIWNWIYNPSFGALNSLLELLNLESLQRGWLGDLDLALPAVFIAWSWVHYGFTMVIFIAALQGIDEVYFDAAKVDGANPFQQLRHILIPFIRAPLTTVILITAISSFQVFDMVFLLTQGGPANATMVLPIFMLNSAFAFRKVGYGAAIAVTLAIFIVFFSYFFLKVRGVLGEVE